MRVVDIIERKEQGAELSIEEIRHLVLGYVRGEVPDYQVAAWLMAVCLRGMTRRETFDLTSVMVESGVTLDLSHVELPVADKHSSGGVGDKTSLVVAPLVRACGVAVGKMSGRGLGFTGGTIDKLESIPGYRVDLNPEEFVRQLEKEGIVLSGQTPELAPADAKLYALRDVTATVASLPLISSSIMSKKLAAGAEAIVLDVKFGSGAFLTSVEDARHLARMMVEIGAAAGRRISGLLTSMAQPLGRAVGNALEVEEAIATLKGEGPRDLAGLSVELAGEVLWLSGKCETSEAGVNTAQSALESGDALEWFRRLIAAQSGDEHVLDDPSILGRAPIVELVKSDRSGWVAELKARDIASAALELGAGREKKGDPIDHQVGVVLRAKVGDRVSEGDTIAEIHARSESSVPEAEKLLRTAYSFSDVCVEPPPVAHERVRTS